MTAATTAIRTINIPIQVINMAKVKLDVSGRMVSSNSAVMARISPGCSRSLPCAFRSFMIVRRIKTIRLSVPVSNTRPMNVPRNTNTFANGLRTLFSPGTAAISCAAFTAVFATGVRMRFSPGIAAMAPPIFGKSPVNSGRYTRSSRSRRAGHRFL